MGKPNISSKIISMLLASVMTLSLLPRTALATVSTANAAEETLSTVKGTVTLEEGAAALKGKNISILGDSISTFTNYSNGKAADYTNSTIRNGVVYYNGTSSRWNVQLNDTWWQQAINSLGMKLLVNNSWGGTCVLKENNGSVGAYIDRCVQLHDNVGSYSGLEPDIIAVYIGTNDFGIFPETLGRASDIDFNALTSNGSNYKTPTTTAEAYTIMMDKMTKRYPKAEIYCFTLLPNKAVTDKATADTMKANKEAFNEIVYTVADHYGAIVVDLYKDSGIVTGSASYHDYLSPDGIHPIIKGMDAITNTFVSAILKNSAYINTTYNVSYDLKNVTVDKKMTTTTLANKPFNLSLTSTNGGVMSVTVTMNGEDITSSCYNNGKISIDTVTGDLVITANAEFSLGTHLQPLPVPVCVNTNLWKALTPEPGLYHMGKEWVNNLYSSITFPVTAGDQIYSNSFGAAVVNGSNNTNGSRLTFFGKDGVIKTLDPAETYAEFSRNNYIVAPDSVTAVNVMMWKNDQNSQVRVLNWAHNYDAVTTEPTCTERGYTTYTCSCGHSYVGNYVDVSSHTYIATITDPTCTDRGYTTYTCSCGHSYVDNYVDAHGHQWDQGVVTTQPTEEQEGVKTYTCKICNETKVEPIEKLPPKPVIPEDHLLDKYLQQLPTPVCAGTNLWKALTPQPGHYDMSKGWVDHQYSSITFPVAAGDQVYSNAFSVSNSSLTFFGKDSVVKSLTAEEIYAEFSQNGYILVPEGTTAVNIVLLTADENSQVQVLNWAHSYGTVITEPTCTEKGYTTYTCSCGHSYVSDYVNSHGHQWDQGVVTTQPTEEQEGARTYTCKICNETKVETIEKLPSKPNEPSITVNPSITINPSPFVNSGAVISPSVTEDIIKDRDIRTDNSKNTDDMDDDDEEEDKPITGERVAFTDVNENDYFYEPVRWATEKGITRGTSETEFNPNHTSNRAEAVTFLWRAAGSPEPTITKNPFTDVNEDAYYYKAILWAYEQEIAQGVSLTEFHPDEGCSRAQVATFLWRSEKRKRPKLSSKAQSFIDTPEDKYYYDAVQWAFENGITTGTTKGTFSPDNACTRAQIVTFLWRANT